MSETIKNALKSITIAEAAASLESGDYHVRKAQALALIAIAEQLQRANELKVQEIEVRNRAVWKMK